MPIVLPNKIDNFLYLLRLFTSRHSRLLISSSVSFLVGAYINFSTDSSIMSFSDVVKRLDPFSQNPLIILPELAFVLLVFLLILRIFLNIHNEKRGLSVLLGEALEGLINPTIKQYAPGRVAIGTNLCLAVAPKIEIGWPLKSIKVENTGEEFILDHETLIAYNKYLSDNSSGSRFVDDGIKFGIDSAPAVFSDARTLQLRLKSTRFSVLSFLREHRWLKATLREASIQEIFRESAIKFPHSFCLHAIVCSSDNKYLVTKRSPNVAYYPNAWSVSLEEQFAEADLSPSTDGALERTAIRLAKEELGIVPGEINIQNARGRALFLEADIMNCSMVADLPLLLTAVQVDNILRGRCRDDYEFTEHCWATLDELAKWLIKPPRDWHFHPSVSLRIFFSLTVKKGPRYVARSILTAG